MTYRYILTFDSDNSRAAVDALKLIENILPYMVDNVDLEPAVLDLDLNMYKAL